MIYLIGGCARTGKSTLAQRFIGDHPVTYIPTDLIYYGLTVAVPELGWNNDLPHMAAAREFERLLFQLAHSLDHSWGEAVIEGVVILPRHVARLRKMKIDVTACFLGWSVADEDLVLTHQGRNDWLAERASGERAQIIRSLPRISRHIERECRRHDLPYFDMADGSYEDQHTRALEALLP